MNENIDKILEDLRDRNNILNYSSALAMCYLEHNSFAPQYRPKFQKYFAPFQHIRNKVFYQIDDITPYLQRHLSRSTIQEAMGGNPNIAIIRIFIAGIPNNDCYDLIDMENDSTKPLQESYNTIIRDVEDMLEVDDIHNSTPIFGKEYWDLYNLNVDFPNDGFLIFTLKIL